MEKQIFKEGDRVFVKYLGWGTIICKASKVKHRIRFDNDKPNLERNIRNNLISFTEYILQGFSQERPINYEDYIGKWGKFFDNEGDEDIVISRLTEFFKSEGVRYLTSYKAIYRFFEPLTEEQIKILGLE